LRGNSQTTTPPRLAWILSATTHGPLSSQGRRELRRGGPACRHRWSGARGSGPRLPACPPGGGRAAGATPRLRAHLPRRRAATQQHRRLRPEGLGDRLRQFPQAIIYTIDLYHRGRRRARLATESLGFIARFIPQPAVLAMLTEESRKHSSFRLHMTFRKA
jgi:hypothetical protein